MSDTSAFGFGKFVPGFDFLQSLAKSASQPSAAGSAVPGMSSWVAPTLSVEELDKRIQELKAVQFWLEQNGTALKATIQALEVQKMTLTTLQGMNVNMGELAKAFTARAPQTPAPATEPAPEPAPQAKPEPAPESEPAPKTKRSSKPKSDQPAAGAAVDPMQWWGSLTQQFQNIASAAMQDVAAQAIKAKSDEAQPKADAPSKPAHKPARKAATRKPAGKKSAAEKTRPPRT
ncbi:MAG: hypothetical protein E6Q48_07780 [Limnohabitans sp.]|nr:MAG: hypothetical protein E6Q48_07780 [Limnohabitans sp.]